MSHSYGWLPDARDEQDLRWHPGRSFTAAHLPSSVDLSTDPAMPPAWDQEQLGSCTAHGTLACFLWASAKVGANDPMLSRLMLYWLTRQIEGTTDWDSGGQIRDAIKATVFGIAPESDWPYDITKFTQEPPANAMLDGKANIGVTYARIEQDLDHMRACLAEGWPIDIGFSVYDSFESAEVARTGEAPMPGPDEEVLGGHCVAIVGYDDSTSRFKLRNSWGTSWGDGGYFTLPYEFLTDPDRASDFWQLTVVT